MDNRPHVEDIDAVFSYGRVSTTKYDFIPHIVMVGIFVILMISIVIATILDDSPLGKSTLESIGIFAFLLSLPIAGSGLFAYLIYKDIKVRKNVKIWLEDAVMVRAKVIIDNISAVSFRYNDKKYVYTKTKTDLSIVIRHKVDVVEVWYSPKYEQLMFTKESAKKVYR